MVICPDCGKDVVDAKFCSNCGATLNNVVGDNAPVEKVNNKIIEVEVKEETATEQNVKKSKFCTNCGKEVELETVFCPKCGYKFGEEKTEPQTKFCQTCGKKININAEICPHCGVRVANIQRSEEKSTLLAVLLCFFFPGLGQLYLGLNKKGVSFIIAYIVSLALCLILIGIILAIAVWIWALVDAIRSTEAINKGEFVEDKLF